MINEHLGDVPRRVADATSAGIVVGTLFDVLPTVAVLLSLFYTLVQLYESKTGQAALRWLRTRLQRRPATAAPLDDGAER
jgi:hypothetical protein